MRALPTLSGLFVACLLGFSSAHAQDGAPPIATPSEGFFKDEIEVTLEPAQDGGQIYYDQDATGAWNILAASPYSGGIKVSANSVIRAQTAHGILGTSKLGTYTYTKSRPPVVNLSTPIAGAIIRSGATVNFTASASDPDNHAVTVSYQYMVGTPGTWQNIGTSGTTPNFPVAWTAPTAITATGYQLRAIATDPVGVQTASNPITVTITPPNQPPMVTLTNPAAGTYIAGQAIAISVNANDQDDVGGAITKLELFHNDTLITTLFSQPYQYSWTNAAVGTHVLQAKALDNNVPPAAGVSQTVTITVKAPNKKPTVTLASSSQGPFVEPAAFRLTASPVDEDGTITSVAFFRGTTQLVRLNAPPWQYNVSGLAAGNHSFTAMAWDNNSPVSDSTMSAALAIPVGSHLPPTLTMGKDTTVLLATPTTVVLRSQASDPEGTAVTYAWTAPAGATLSDATAQNPTATLSSAIEYTFNLTVTDAGSPPRASTGKIKVTVVSKPVITSSLTETATVGSAYSYAMAASGSTPITWTATGLPAWLTRPAGGTTLSGTPPIGAGGTANIVLTATHATAGNDQKTVVLTIREAARITQEPLDTTVQENARAVLSVISSGYPAPTYTWQLLPPGGGAPAPVGTNSPTLVFDPAEVANSGNYRVIVKNAVNPPDTSRTTKLTVRAALRMVTQPVRLEIMVGRRATLQAKAAGAGPIKYQWYRNGASVSTADAKDSTYVLDPVQLNQAGLYRARVTNSFSDTNSVSTFLWTDTARLIVLQPKVDRPKATPGAPADFGINGLTVSLAVDTPSSNIRYTTNGSDPSTPTSGNAYDAGNKIKLTGATTTIKARAFRTDYLASDLFTGTYNYVEPDKAAKPTAKPGKSTFTATVLCTLSTSTDKGQIKYTTDGKDPRVSGQEYKEPFLIKATTTVSAYATATGFKDSDTLLKVYTQDNPIPKAPAPGVTPPTKSFTLSQSVTFTSALDSVTIRYTTDGSSPDSSKTGATIAKNVPLPPFTKTTVLKAVLTRSGYNPSDMVTNTYTLLPGPIEAVPAPVGGTYIFVDTQLVTLKVNPIGAAVWYTTNDSLPLDDLNRPVIDAKRYDPQAGITLKSTFTITAMAISDSAASEVYRFSYAKLGGPLPTPSVTTSNGTYSFKDTLRITLTRTNGADIRFTRDGTDPNSGSELYSKPFTIDSSMTLQAIAMIPDSVKKPEYQPSRILVANFTLVADKPEAEPPGGSYFVLPTVTLTAKSRKTPIWYTTDGSVPVPGDGAAVRYTAPFGLTGSTQLKSVAVSGSMAGPVREDEYRIFSTARDTLLRPGETFFLEGGLSLSNPSGSVSAVRVQQGAPDSRYLAGFSSVNFNLILSQAEGSSGEGFPEVVLSRSASEARSLFKLMPDGKVYFISSESQVVISEAGTYFTGLDSKPPVITYVGESINDSGFTAVRFKVTDNVTNLFFNTLRNDNPTLNESRKPVLSGSDLDFRLKHASGILKPLYLQLSVHDYTQPSYCPADGQSYLSLSQDMRDLKGPDRWRIGGNPALPHDLVGIPLDAHPSLTVADLRDSRGGRVEALVYQQQGSSKWRKLAQTEALVPGRAYWIGAAAALQGLNRATLRTNALGMGKYKVELKHGWNQVANPHLETLYWPFARSQGDYYRASAIKGLWAYVPEDSRVYVEKDSLEPWKGYYVYSYIQKDTSVELLTKPMLKPVQKKQGATWEASLALSYGDAPQVRLGATPDGRDAVGWDDEGALPSLSGRNRFKAVRDGRSLSTDWIRLDQDRVLQWRVLPVSAEEGPRIDAPGTGPAVHVHSQDLPEGYEAWALSRLRGMKFRLQEGLSLPASGLPEDTLLVVAGPAAKLADFSLLKDLAASAPVLGLRVLDRGAGPEMILDLPARSSVRATLWTVRGTSLGRIERTLPGGRYHFGLARDLAGARGLPGSGLAFLRVEVRGPDGPAYLVRKVVFKD